MEVKSLNNLIKAISKLPGLGPRSARRIVLYLIKNLRTVAVPLAESINVVANEVKVCEVCGNIDMNQICSICTNSERDQETLCIIEDVTDLWAIERANFYKGVYHVLGGTLSALDGRTPETLNFDSLKGRIANSNVREVIIATNATLEGQTTAFYIVDILKQFNLKISRLAHGIPMGGELDYIDEGTLALALKMRHDF